MADAENTAPASLTAEGAAVPGGTAAAPAATLDDARLGVRFAGYCVYCDHIVERAEDGGCPKGHPADGVTGRIVLIDDDPLPELPSFSWAAFLVPFVWGPAHGQWVGLLFLPIWVFVDSILGTAGRGGAAAVGAAVVLAATLAFEWLFAKRANGLAFRRVITTQTAEEFTRRQRIWAIAAVPAAMLLLACAIWFHIAGVSALRVG